MALTEAEELELLELEEAEALAKGQTPKASEIQAVPEAPTESRAKRYTRNVAKALPILGGIGGSFVAPVAGTAAGTAAGAGVKEAILSALGDQAPTLPEVAGRVGLETAIAGTLGAAGKGLGMAGKFVKSAVTAPTTAEARIAAQEGIEALGKKGVEELTKLRAGATAAKQGLIEAEEKAGLHFASSPGFEATLRNPAKVAKTLQKINSLTAQGPEAIAAKLDSKSIQALRKFLQEAEKKSGLSDIAVSEMKQAKGILVEALKKTQPEVVEPLGKLSAAEKAVKEFPKMLKERLKSAKMEGMKNVSEAQKAEVKRRILKALATAVVAGSGIGLAQSLFK